MGERAVDAIRDGYHSFCEMDDFDKGDFIVSNAGLLRIGRGLCRMASNKKIDIAGPYKIVKGHHVHAKAAFKDCMSYDPKKGFSISQQFMKYYGLDHMAMTRFQRQAFKELATSERANTMKEHSRIAVEALLAGGATKEMARSLTAQSLRSLRSDGVKTPSNIPWYDKKVKQ